MIRYLLVFFGVLVYGFIIIFSAIKNIFCMFLLFFDRPHNAHKSYQAIQTPTLSLAMKHAHLFFVIFATSEIPKNN